MRWYFGHNEWRELEGVEYQEEFAKRGEAGVGGLWEIVYD